MSIIITLSEMMNAIEPDQWERFCDDFGYSLYAINEGGGDIEVILTKDQARYYGVM